MQIIVIAMHKEKPRSGGAAVVSVVFRALWGDVLLGRCDVASRYGHRSRYRFVRIAASIGQLLVEIDPAAAGSVAIITAEVFNAGVAIDFHEMAGAGKDGYGRRIDQFAILAMHEHQRLTRRQRGYG